MGRIRAIRPEFFKHERLADLPPLHRLLFIGLWTQADRAGRLEYRPRRLKVEILPFDDCDLGAMIADLERHPDHLVKRYCVDGATFLQITNFERYQRPHPKEHASTIPERPENTDDSMHGSCMTHACLMHEPSMTHASIQPCNHAASEVTQAEAVTATATATPAPEFVATAERETFDVFWEHYPRKTDKQEAFGIWRKIALDRVPEVMSGLLRWVASPEWKDGFAPSPARFLRREKWLDEPPPERARSATNRTAAEKTMDNVRKFLKESA